MRIGIDGRVLSDRYPGIGRATATLLAALAEEARHELVVFHRPGAAPHRLAVAGLELVAAPAELRSLAEHLRLPAMARRLRLDLVHSPYLATAGRWPCPWVVTVHDLIPVRFPSGLGLVARAAYRAFIRQAVRRATLITTPSRASARDLERLTGVAHHRMRVVHNAVDPGFRPRADASAVAALHDLGIQRPFVLAHASERPHKNRSRLLDAWSRLDRPEQLLLFGGDRLPRTGSGVRELGRVDDEVLVALYSAAELFVLPSLWEGFGLTVAEAMACGTAVACATGSALDEVAGPAAARFDPMDAAAIAGAVQALLDDPDRRAELGRLGLARARRFSPQLSARAMVAAYEDAAGIGKV
jgi:alpha-1,3-rhamnosyl/mannosyltransferase